ncbi:MAG: hypothetical protein HYV63_00855 [Candidatus Schekmanbacteria bacterium]|nr:hypothetical protein [Candidatus Schekmanbacteria bacterium]
MGKLFITNPATGRRSRRRFLVDRRFQLAYIIALSALAASMIVSASLALQANLRRLLEDLTYRTHLPTDRVWDLVWEPFARVNAVFAIATVLLAAAVLVALNARATARLKALEHAIAGLDQSGQSPRRAHVLRPPWDALVGEAQAAIQVQLDIATRACERLRTASATPLAPAAARDAGVALRREVSSALADLVGVAAFFAAEDAGASADPRTLP